MTTSGMTISGTDLNGLKRNENGTFAVGNVGGPGRPAFSIITILKEELQKVPENQKHTHAYLLVQRILKAAIADGNDQQIKNILQYVEGMPKQRLEIEGEIRTALVEFIDGENPDKDTEAI